MSGRRRAGRSFFDVVRRRRLCFGELTIRLRRMRPRRQSSAATYAWTSASGSACVRGRMSTETCGYRSITPAIALRTASRRRRRRCGASGGERARLRASADRRLRRDSAETISDEPPGRARWRSAGRALRRATSTARAAHRRRAMPSLCARSGPIHAAARGQSSPERRKIGLAGVDVDAFRGERRRSDHRRRSRRSGSGRRRGRGTRRRRRRRRNGRGSGRNGRRRDSRRGNDARAGGPARAQIDADPVGRAPTGRGKDVSRMIQRRQTATGAGGRSRICVGRPSAVISIRTVNGGCVLGRKRLGAFEQGVAELLLVEARRDARGVGPSFRSFELRLGFLQRVVESVRPKGSGHESEGDGRRDENPPHRAFSAPAAWRRQERPERRSRSRTSRKSLRAAGDHVLGDREREPQMALSLGAEDDPRHGRDLRLVEQDPSGRAGVGRQPRGSLRKEIEGGARRFDLEARALQARDETVAPGAITGPPLRDELGPPRQRLDSGPLRRRRHAVGRVEDDRLDGLLIARRARRRSRAAIPSSSSSSTACSR